MNALTLWAVALLLFGLLFVMFRSLFVIWAGKRKLQARLTRKPSYNARRMLLAYLEQWPSLRGHLADLLETLRLRIKPETFAFTSGLLLFAGVATGGLFFQSVKGTLLFGAMIGGTPYVCLRMLLLHRRMQARIDFLPAVELFYQCYLVTGESQVRTALQRTVDERRLLGPMQAVFEQLYRNLSVRGDDEASLRLMAASLGHVWSDYFINILRVSLTEGVAISEGLRELISDMRKARRSSEQERHRLLEIRVANFSPIVFLALFVGINIRYNPHNSYYYYVLSPEGREMLLNALVLIFASFLMGLWLSRKKM